MDFRCQTNKRLHEEHAASLSLLARLERAVSGRSCAYPPAAQDREWQACAGAVLAAIDVEVARHFDFEERELFPRLEQSGDGDLAALLAEEHVTIRAVAQRLAELLRDALGGGLAPPQWQTLKTLALEFSERLAAHAQKEDGALLPVLEQLLDEETDRALFGAYASG